MSKYLPEGELWRTPENRLALSSPERLAAAAAAGAVLEAFVPKCDKDYRLRPDLGVMPGVIAREEGALGVREGLTREIALITRVGKPVQFVVTGFSADEQGAPVAVCSRRLAQERCRRGPRKSRSTTPCSSASTTWRSIPPSPGRGFP